MKKIILISCIILLSSISLLFALEEFSTEPISLDEFIEEYLPDYTIQKRIPLEGIGRAYAVAKDSGNIVAITEVGDQFKVHYFDIEGNLRWTKDFDKVKDMRCKISDNGETICLYITPKLDVRKPTGLLGIINTILSKEGDVLYTKLLECIDLIPSPNGKYLYKSTGNTPDYEMPYFGLYNTDGTLVDIQGFNTTNIVRTRLKFVSNNHILAFIGKKIEDEYSNYFLFLKLEDKAVISIWEYEIGSEQSLTNQFDEKVKVKNNKIAVSGHASGSKLYVFNFAGELLYFEDTSYQSFDFVNDDELFLQTITAKGKYSKLLNLSTKEIRKEDIFFGYEKYIKQIDKKTYEYDEFDNLLELNDLLLLSIKRYPYSERKFYTIILDMNDWKNSKNIEQNVDFIAVNNYSFFILEKYYENPEILILQGGGK